MAGINPGNNTGEKAKFKDPKNPTDPIVVFDPEFGFSQIVLPFDNNYDGNLPETNDENHMNSEAIRTPLIKLNNKLIFASNIYSMKIYIKDFLPSIELIVDDPDQNIQGTDIPGMNNVITVIMMSPVDGANKKISLDFYITNCVFNPDNTITYQGELKVNGLKQVKYSQVGDSQLSTYEFLEKIARELKLGFAATDKCKDVNDKRWRQVYSKTYKDFIKQEIEFAGMDETTIFDAWIDNFGYLVMVNLYYIFNEQVEVEQLSTNVISGNLTSLPKEAVPEPTVEEIYRIITNARELPMHYNLYFEEYHSSVDNSKILDKGTNNRYYWLMSPCDENLIMTQYIQIMESSVDGMEGADEYTYENIEFIGTNQEDDDAVSCKTIQKEIRTNFLNKIYAKSLQVKLVNANYSLQRGMLVTVMINEYSERNKQFAMNNADSAMTTEANDNTEAPDMESKERETVIDGNNGVTNMSLTGIYYIKDIMFEYNGSNPNIYQTLTLIKTGLQNNLHNKYTSMHSVK